MVRSKSKRTRASAKAPRPEATPDAPPIVAATNDYERWLHKRLDVVKQDLKQKHEDMAGSLFAFLRATFYRWVPLWQEVCPDLAETPPVLAVAISMSRTSGPGAMPRAGWSGASMISMKSPACHTPSISFGWSQARYSPNARTIPPATPPKSIQRLLQRWLPDGVTDIAFFCRTAGVGSLGRPRYVVIANCNGGLAAREAKAWLPSAWGWATGWPKERARPPA